MDEKKGKKGGKVGRPRTKVGLVKLDHIGILGAPSDSSLIVEMVYCGSELFKRIFALFKTYKIVELTINFGKTTVVFNAFAPSGISIKFTIDVNNINQYYCGQNTTILIKNENLSVFNNLEK